MPATSLRPGPKDSPQLDLETRITDSSEMDEIINQAKVNFKQKKPLFVAQRLPRMYDTAKLEEKNNQEKIAFIFFQRWLNIIEWLKNTKDYRLNTSDYTQYFNNDQVEEVKFILGRLEKSLISQLEPQKRISDKNGTSDSATTASVPGSEKSTASSFNLPETPTEEPLPSESDEFLSCLQLYQLIKPNARLLIIDVRPEANYMASRIKSDQCINIPEEKIKAGVIASSFEKLLSKNKEACRLFSRRGAQHVDTVVLLDWCTTSKTLFPNVRVRVLKDILERWDPGTRCARIRILEGGYAEWLNCYPAYVTNSNVKAPDLTSDAMDEILEDVEYPDWLNADDSSSPFKSLRITPLPPKAPKPKSVEPTIANPPASKSAADRSARPSYNATDSRTAAYNEKNDSASIYPNASDALDKLANESVERMREEFSTPPRKLDNHREPEDMLTDDEEIFSNRQPGKSALHSVAPKPLVDRTSKPSSLTSRYADCTNMLHLLRLLCELVEKEREFEAEDVEIEKRYLQDGAEDRKIAKGRSEEIKSQLEEVRKKKAQVKIALEVAKVDETLMSPRDREKRQALESSIVAEKERLAKLSIERKKLHESFREQERARQQMQARNENGVHREPLKFDGSAANSGLKRSHSSPNLAQLDVRKIPHVDRSSKPHVPVPQMPSRARNNQKFAHFRSKDREGNMEPVYRDVHPGITGLKNLGNSCYMNSIIQCLSNTAYLAKYFNDNKHIDHLNTSNDNCSQSLVADEVAHVIKALWRGQYKSISPRDLKVVIGQYKLQFDTTEQQDSHEFLTFLLDWMHNDLKREIKRRVDGPLSPAEKEWDKAMESRQSIISELFFGQLRSSIICATCGNSSITYETFNSLTMSLPHTNRCKLEDCVKKYVSGQKVSGWKCPNCKVPRDATKKFDFMKLAPIVVIHLNRFAESDGWLEKKNTSVEFPLDNFNLEPYLVPDLESSNTGNQLNHHNYSLYAVSNHYGTMDGGHYTAYCKSSSQNKWYKYDDQTVSEVERSSVNSQTSSAYLLFYTSIASDQFAYR